MLEISQPFMTGGSSGPKRSVSLVSPDSLISSVSMGTGAPGNTFTSSVM